MNPRAMSLVLVVLLAATGCMSVPAAQETPASVAPVTVRTVPATPAPVAPDAPPAAHDALGKVGKQPSGKKRKPAAKRGPDRRDGTFAPPEPPEPRGVRERPRYDAPGVPQARRTLAPRVVRPGRTYDMRTVCAAGRGVTSPGLVDLCRSTYGR